MGFLSQYERAKPALLNDPEICAENRALFAEFFAYLEYKLKRQNGLAQLDDGCGNTLYGYIMRFRNVNRWFENKPWKELTREDIKRVYDGLEDGTIRNRQGKPFADPAGYYNKIFKSKPFRMAGKADLAREVIEFSTVRKKAVRFVPEDAFRRIVSVISNPRHLFLLWLAWDIGENIDTLLQLTRQDFIAQVNRHTQDREYLVNLPTDKLKRSRQTRSEVTLYPETARYADMVLDQLEPTALVFDFGYRYANKLLSIAVRKSGAVTMPYGEPVRWKDLRSGMACHLLRMGWTRDEVNARLGHTPHSSALNAYVNFLALDRETPKRRMVQNTVDALQKQLRVAKQTAALASDRSHRTDDENRLLRHELSQTRSDISALRAQLYELVAALRTRPMFTQRA